MPAVSSELISSQRVIGATIYKFYVKVDGVREQHEEEDYADPDNNNEVVMKTVDTVFTLQCSDEIDPTDALTQFLNNYKDNLSATVANLSDITV